VIGSTLKQFGRAFFDSKGAVIPLKGGIAFSI